MLVTELKQLVKNVFNKAKFQYVNDIIEKTEVGYNLTYYFYGMTYQSNFIAYSKITFMLTDDKKQLKEDKLLILLSLNCDYYTTDFTSEDHLGSLLINFLDKGYDKGDIRELSNLLISGTSNINNLIKQTKTNNFIISVVMTPNEKYEMCQKLIFDLIVTDNEGDKSIKLQKKGNKWIISGDLFSEEIKSLDDFNNIVVDKLIDKK